MFSLKDQDSVGIFDAVGDIHVEQKDQLGLFYRGMRYLSHLEITVHDGIKPYLLNSSLHRHGTLLAVDQTNPKTSIDAEMNVHIHREILIFERHCIVRTTIQNFNRETIRLPVAVNFAADFKDIFEVKGWQRKAQSHPLPAEIGKDSVKLRCRGADEVLRMTFLGFSHPPDRLLEDRAEYVFELEFRGAAAFEVSIDFLEDEETSRNWSFQYCLNELNIKNHRLRRDYCSIQTDNEQLNQWIERSLSDLVTLTTEKQDGPYPYAGIPWYSTVFGRDGIITVLQLLWTNPALAKGVLNYLANHQATELNDENEAQPGKILHEVRHGELAQIKEVPFAKYYGSVDATPLFLVLAGAYYERTADHQTIEKIWPHIEAAVRWIEEYGDCDGDGYVEYPGQPGRGLIHQGWKDSHDSVFYENGEDVRGPVALCEVQGYVCQAYRSMAFLAMHMSKDELAKKMSRRAKMLQEKIETDFWDERSGFMHMALDGEKKPCRIKTSNPGHCLFSGVLSPEKAKAVADTLLSDDFFTGWGIRTLAAGQPRYNPMSYHNGSVWPHDNCMIIYGFSRYGFNDHVLRVFNGLFEATYFTELNRLPELFCGFKRRMDEGPTLYPVACSPQAWASTSIFTLMQSLLGLKVNSLSRTVTFSAPVLPKCINEVSITGLRLGEETIDLKIDRYESDVGIQVIEKPASVKVIVEK